MLKKTLISILIAATLIPMASPALAFTMPSMPAMPKIQVPEFVWPSNPTPPFVCLTNCQGSKITLNEAEPGVTYVWAHAGSSDPKDNQHKVVGEINIPAGQEDYYKLNTTAVFDGPADQMNESFYFVVEDAAGQMHYVRDNAGNLGQYQIVVDGGTETCGSQDGGTFYFDQGVNKLHMYHYGTIANQTGMGVFWTGSFWDGTLNTDQPESVKVKDICTEFVAAVEKPILSVTQTVSDDDESKVEANTARPDEEITYYITYTNTGNAPANNLRATNVYNINQIEVLDNALGTDNGQGQISWVIGDFAPGLTYLFSIKAKIKAGLSDGDQIVNQINFTSDNHAEVTDSVITTVTLDLPPVLPARPGTMISLTFDDGLSSVYNLAKPVLDTNGLTATAYIYTDPIKKNDPEHMNWTQIKALQNESGWEIGSHSITHPFLTTMTAAQITRELRNSKNDLVGQGLKVESFASPYGDYSLSLMAEASKYYTSHRSAWQDYNTFPANDYELRAFMVGPNTPPGKILEMINQARQDNLWLILVFHGLHEGVTDDDFYNYNNFLEVVGYVKNSGLPVTQITETTRQWASGDNLITNGSFEQGVGYDATGWFRNTNKQVRVVAQNKGAYPDYRKSVKMTGGSSQYHIFTRISGLSDKKSYAIRLWERILSLTSGSIEVWVSEFNEDGGYMGGQWIGGTWGPFVGNRYFEYTPTSGTKSIEMYIFTPAGSKMDAFLDNVEMREVGL